MTDTANLGTIYAVGQRRAPGGTFPSPAGGGGGGGVPDIIGVEQDEVELNPELPPTHPCGDPETALEWNADAAAAEALRRMIAAAAAQNDPTHHLANREYGAMICERSDGVLTISPIVWGDPIFDAAGNWTNPGEQPTVPVNIDVCGVGSMPLAMIHTHPNTGDAGAIPSWADAQWVASINARRSDDLGRIYVVAIDGTSFRIEVYDQSNAGAWGTGERGPEVNPDAQPCTGGAFQ